MPKIIKNFADVQGSNYFTIVESIVKYIKDSGLQPGDKLLSESELAEELHINRSTLREGLRVAEAFGIIESRRGSSNVYYGDIEVGFMNLFMLQEILSENTKMDITNIRAVIEADAVEKFIQKATDYDMFMLEMIYREQMQSVLDKSTHAYIECHIMFHDQIMKYDVTDIAKHIARTGLRMVDNARVRRFDMAPRPLNEKQKKYLEEVQIASHENIVNAIKEKNIPKAKSLMVSHILIPGEIDETF